VDGVMLGLIGVDVSVGGQAELLAYVVSVTVQFVKATAPVLVTVVVTALFPPDWSAHVLVMLTEGVKQLTVASSKALTLVTGPAVSAQAHEIAPLLGSSDPNVLLQVSVTALALSCEAAAPTARLMPDGIVKMLIPPMPVCISVKLQLSAVLPVFWAKYRKLTLAPLTALQPRAPSPLFVVNP
jgi:hypothetical protein